MHVAKKVSLFWVVVFALMEFRPAVETTFFIFSWADPSVRGFGKSSVTEEVDKNSDKHQAVPSSSLILVMVEGAANSWWRQHNKTTNVALIHSLEGPPECLQTVTDLLLWRSHRGTSSELSDQWPCCPWPSDVSRKMAESHDCTACWSRSTSPEPCTKPRTDTAENAEEQTAHEMWGCDKYPNTGILVSCSRNLSTNIYDVWDCWC